MDESSTAMVAGAGVRVSEREIPATVATVKCIRCSSRGRGPRRWFGRGASARSIMPRHALRAGWQECTGRPRAHSPALHQPQPNLLWLPVGCQRVQLALPDRDPILPRFSRRMCGSTGRTSFRVLRQANRPLRHTSIPSHPGASARYRKSGTCPARCIPRQETTRWCVAARVVA